MYQAIVSHDGLSWAHSGKLSYVMRAALQDVNGWHGYFASQVEVWLDGEIVIAANGLDFEDAALAYVFDMEAEAGLYD